MISSTLDANKILEAMINLATKLQLQRFSTVVEKRTQMEVEHFLVNEGFSFEREKRLSDRDIPDFLIQYQGFNMVLEVKTRAQRKAIYRQLVRYTEHQEVDVVILLTGTSMGLPSIINGKPTIIVSLGEGWL